MVVHDQPTGATSVAPSEASVLGGDAYQPQPRFAMSAVRTVLGRPVLRGITFYLLIGLLVGLLAGLLWHAVVDLPVYRVGSDGAAETSERGLAGFFAVDAWFCLLGALCGTALGALAWRWFRRLGWPVVVLALLAALLAGLVCWWMGTGMGPDNFAVRISNAASGDEVPVDFVLHSPAALLIWPFFTSIPVLLASSLGHDEDDPGHKSDQRASAA